MEIRIFTRDTGRQPYVKWYNDQDKMFKKIIDRDIQELMHQDFKSDNILPNTIVHLRNQPKTSESSRTDHLYELKVTYKRISARIYFGVIDDEILIFTGGSKDDQFNDIEKVRQMYIDYLNTEKNPPSIEIT